MRLARSVLVVLMLLVLPLRGMAAVAMALGPSGAQGDAVEAAVLGHDHGCCHEADEAPIPGEHGKHCAEQGCCAAFAVSAPAAVLSASARHDRIRFSVPFLAWHVPEHLDPPPLAL